MYLPRADQCGDQRDAEQEDAIPKPITLDTYYEMAGWDKRTGNPTKEKLAELGLEWIA